MPVVEDDVEQGSDVEQIDVETVVLTVVKVVFAISDVDVAASGDTENKFQQA